MQCSAAIIMCGTVCQQSASPNDDTDEYSVYRHGFVTVNVCYM